MLSWFSRLWYKPLKYDILHFLKQCQKYVILTHKKYVNCNANIAIPSLSYEPATDLDIYPGAI